jgi:hypothetical protein
MNIQIGSLVKFNGCFCTSEVIEINGKMAKIDHAGEILNKRLSSLTVYEYKAPYIDEQESAHWEAVAADMKHGVVQYSIIDANGTGGTYVYDEVKNDIVRREELSELPE